MGNGTPDTKNTVKKTTKFDLDIDQSLRNKIDQECSQLTSQSNLAQIVGSNVKNLTINQDNVAKNLCRMQTAIESARDAKQEQDILNQISQAAETEGGFPGTGGDAENITDIYNHLKSTVDQSEINELTKKCIMEIDQKNVVQIFGSNVQDSTINQVNDGFNECIQSDEIVAESGWEGRQQDQLEVDQQATSSAMTFADLLPIWPSVGFLGSFALPIFISIGCCLFILISSSLMGGGMGGGMGGQGMTNIKVGGPNPSGSHMNLSGMPSPVFSQTPLIQMPVIPWQQMGSQFNKMFK